MKNGRIEIGDYVKAKRDDPPHGSLNSGLMHGDIENGKIYKVTGIKRCEPSICKPKEWNCTAKQLMRLKDVTGGKVWCWCGSDFELVKSVKPKKVKKPKTRMEDLIL